MRSFFLAFILCACYTSFAQRQTYTLTGMILGNEQQQFSYKLVFTDSAGYIKGYSLTYDEPDQAKTAITGRLDKANRTLAFKETDIISSHGYHLSTFMCLIKAKLEYSNSGKGNTLNGKITSAEADNTSCQGGMVVFSKEDEIKKLFYAQEQFDTVISMKTRPKAVAPLPAPEPVKAQSVDVADKITAGVEKTYTWHADSAIVYIWDGGVTDGDRITVKYNGAVCLNGYSLVKERKQLRLPVKKGENTLLILADNEGSDPPNTATISLMDGTTEHRLLAYNTVGKSAVIKLVRQ